MKLKYFKHHHMGAIRLYVKDKKQRMWYMKLTSHATITDSDYQALEALGVKLIEVKPPKEKYV